MKIIIMMIITLYITNDTYKIHSYCSKTTQAYKNHGHLPAPISILPVSSRPRPPSRCSWDCPRHPVLPWPPPSPSRPHVPQHCWRLGLPWRPKAAWTGSTCHTPPGKNGGSEGTNLELGNTRLLAFKLRDLTCAIFNGFHFKKSLGCSIKMGESQMAHSGTYHLIFLI